jgi:hypothetical protein
MVSAEAIKYKTKTEFRNESSKAYSIAKKRGIVDQVCSHMETIYVRWTDVSLEKEARKFSTRSEFKQESESAYQTAFGRGILNKICSHMEELHRNWTLEELHLEALKHNTRTEFQKSGSSYLVALRRGVLEQICGHMIVMGSTSIAEKELFGLIKDIYPSTKKTRDMRVKIEGKPYIKGFEIDVFVPELKLGIEYDGEYYHSYEYMRADPDKAKWSDEDIRNYHKLKDDWFESKGIKIHHAKEEDWNKDKQACIQLCLDFLVLNGF